MEYHGEIKSCFAFFFFEKILHLVQNENYFLQFASDFSIVAEITSIATLL